MKEESRRACVIICGKNQTNEEKKAIVGIGDGVNNVEGVFEGKNNNHY